MSNKKTKATKNEEVRIQEVPTVAPLSPVHAKFMNFRNHLASRLVERDEEIDLTLTAMLSNEHVCLVSVPGTAKSMLSDAIVRWIDGTSFSYLLTKFTTTEEIFGPINVKEMVDSGRYMRNTEGRLPTASVAFLDEIWKGSSSILNTTLKILNERKYVNDTETIHCPLRLCLAASNEWPSGDSGRELGALFDRFLIRRHMRNTVTEGGMRQIVWGNTDTTFNEHCTVEELDQAHREVKDIQWEESAKETYMDILSALSSEGIEPGPRRYKKAGLAVKAAAWLDGSSVVTTEHMGILADCLWVDPIDQPAKAEKVIRKIAAPLGMKISGIMQDIHDIIQKLPKSDEPQKAAQHVVTAISKIRTSQAALKKLGEDNPKVVVALNRTVESIRLLQARAMESMGAL